MELLIEWLGQYSAPIIVLLASGAALLFAMRTVTEKAVAAQIERYQKEITLRLERRSRFEERVLLDQYTTVGELLGRMVRVTTDLNRRAHGVDVEGLYHGNELVPLTAVYEDLSSKRYLLGERFHPLLLQLANTVLALANARDDAQSKQLQARYLAELNAIYARANEAFGLTSIKWD